MNLIEIVRQIESLEQSDVIYATLPWTRDSSVELLPPQSEDEEFEPDRNGRRYFMEVFVAADCLEQLRQIYAWMTLEQLCDRLIEYGVNDA